MQSRRGGDSSLQTFPIERLATPDEVARRGADLVEETLRREREPVLLLPAGASPVPVYAELVRRQSEGRVDLTQAHLFQLDELVGVAPDDPRSFQGFLRRHLIDSLPSEERCHLLDGSRDDPEAAIYEHAAALERLGGTHLALLGLGLNGHVAFNEPGSSLDAPARLVELAEPSRAALAPAFEPDEPPVHGITLGMHEIHAAGRIVVIATGAGKAKIVRRLQGEVPAPKLPASLLTDHPEFRVVCDEAAAALL